MTELKRFSFETTGYAADDDEVTVTVEFEPNSMSISQEVTEFDIPDENLPDVVAYLEAYGAVNGINAYLPDEAERSVWIVPGGGQQSAWLHFYSQRYPDVYSDVSASVLCFIPNYRPQPPAPPAKKGVPLVPPCPYGLTHFGQTALQTKLEAGDGITIEGNVISATAEPSAGLKPMVKTVSAEEAATQPHRLYVVVTWKDGNTEITMRQDITALGDASYNATMTSWFAAIGTTVACMAVASGALYVSDDVLIGDWSGLLLGDVNDPVVSANAPTIRATKVEEDDTVCYVGSEDVLYNGGRTLTWSVYAAFYVQDSDQPDEDDADNSGPQPIPVAH